MNNFYHVIKDPVHGTMEFTSLEDAWVKPFIDSNNFQRLRHIKQLGLGDFIFPGAVHTRFNHCLGCCYVASQIAHKIGLSDSERQLVMIACLLHDIGHGPFSHAFEDLFNDKLVRHEDWTPRFLADFSNEEFFQNYNRLNPRYHLSQEKFNEIAEMIMHRPIAKRVLADIVSSQLDADRLDYLLRDSHFCGVAYGEFDFRWMLHCMTMVDSPIGERLGITHKGIGVIEHYLMARRLMTRNIYHSQKKLALETFLVQMLATLAASLETNSIFNAIRHTQLGKFLSAVNQTNQDLKEDNKEKLKTQFIADNFELYKQLSDYDVFVLIKQLSELNEKHPAIQLARRLQRRIMPKIIRLDHVNLKQVEEELTEFKQKFQQQYQDWQIMLIKTPHQAYSGEEDPILVINELGKINPVGDFSFMLNAMADKLEHTAFISIDKIIIDDPAINNFILYLRSQPALV